MMKENRLVRHLSDDSQDSIFLVGYSLFVSFNFRHSKLYPIKTSKSSRCRLAEGFVAKAAVFFANTVTAEPMGLYTTELVGPKTANVLTPNAAAKCVIPLSLPMNPFAQLKISNTCARDKFVRHLATLLMFLIVASLNLSSSLPQALWPQPRNCLYASICFFHHCPAE